MISRYGGSRLTFKDTVTLGKDYGEQLQLPRETLESFRLGKFFRARARRRADIEMELGVLADEFHLFSSEECAKAANFLPITAALDIMLMRRLGLPLK